MEIWFLRYGYFLPFYPKNFENKKKKKKPRDINMLHIYTINDNHIMYGIYLERHSKFLPENDCFFLTGTVNKDSTIQKEILKTIIFIIF